MCVLVYSFHNGCGHKQLQNICSCETGEQHLRSKTVNRINTVPRVLPERPAGTMVAELEALDASPCTKTAATRPVDIACDACLRESAKMAREAKEGKGKGKEPAADAVRQGSEGRFPFASALSTSRAGRLAMVAAG